MLCHTSLQSSRCIKCLACHKSSIEQALIRCVWALRIRTWRGLGMAVAAWHAVCGFWGWGGGGGVPQVWVLWRPLGRTVRASHRPASRCRLFQPMRRLICRRVCIDMFATSGACFGVPIVDCHRHLPKLHVLIRDALDACVRLPACPDSACSDPEAVSAREWAADVGPPIRDDNR